jgi:hypothetical protein
MSNAKVTLANKVDKVPNSYNIDEGGFEKDEIRIR